MENGILEYELYRLEVIKSRLLSVIGRLIVTIVLVFAIGIFSEFKDEKISIIIITFLAFYVIVSDVWFCARVLGNWILGIIAFVVMIFACSKIAELGAIGSAIGIVLLIGVIFIDVYNVIMYIKQKSKVLAMNIKMRKISRQELKYYRNYYKNNKV